MAALYSILLKLVSESGSTLSPTQGHHAYALFLDLLNQSSPRLAAELHKEGTNKPFTISPLMGRFKRTSGGIAVAAGAECSIRITFLREDIFAHFMDATYITASRPLRLESAVFRLEQVCFNSRQSPHCRTGSYEELFYTAPAVPSVTLRFTSPTAFRSGGKRNVLFPDPALVFTGYLRKWQYFSPVRLDEDLAGHIRQVTLARHRLRTYILHFSGYQETGFEGECLFNLPAGLCENKLKMLNALADFAFYCGTGAKTTMGMGQTRRKI